MKSLEKIWPLALFVFAVSGLSALVVNVSGFFSESVEAQNVLCWIAGISWIIGAIVLGLDFWGKNEVSIFVMALIPLGFGLALAILGILFVASGFVPELALHDAFCWASVGLLSIALFVLGMMMELKVLIHILQKDWFQSKLLGMLTGGLVCMAIAVVLITGFSLLSIGQAVVIAFCTVALVAGAVSGVIVLAKKILNVLAGIFDEIIRSIGLG